MGWCVCVYWGLQSSSYRCGERRGGVGLQTHSSPHTGSQRSGHLQQPQTGERHAHHTHTQGTHNPMYTQHTDTLSIHTHMHTLFALSSYILVLCYIHMHIQYDHTQPLACFRANYNKENWETGSPSFPSTSLAKLSNMHTPNAYAGYMKVEFTVPG